MSSQSTSNQRPRSVTATRGAASRSDSRKRGRRSESPEPQQGRLKDKQLTKKQRKVPTKEDITQTKITSFSENNTPDAITETETTTNMAAENNTLSKSQFESLMSEFEKMHTKIDQHIQKVDDRMDKIESKMMDLKNKQDKTDADLDNVNQKLEACSEKMIETEHAANLALSYAERNEQYQRNFNVRIFNLPEEANESIYDCEAKVLALFKDKLGVEVAIESIDILHRLGPKPRQAAADTDANETKENNQSNENVENPPNSPQASGSGSDKEMETQTEKENPTEKTSPRPVIVSFVSRRVRRDILANRHKLKKRADQTSAPIIIAEDLTKQRHALFSKTRENKEKFKKVWSKDGRIFGRQHNGIDIQINTYFDISSPMVTKTSYRGGSMLSSPRGRGGRGGFFARGRGYYYTRRGQGRHSIMPGGYTPQGFSFGDPPRDVTEY